MNAYPDSSQADSVLKIVGNKIRRHQDLLLRMELAKREIRTLPSLKRRITRLEGRFQQSREIGVSYALPTEEDRYSNPSPRDSNSNVVFLESLASGY